MGKSYSHLDHKERTLIYWWRKEELSLRDMARRQRRCHTSISRELKRNRWCGKEYFPRGAQLLAGYRLQDRAPRGRLKSQPVRAYVQQKLRMGWTPELIAERRIKQQKKLPTVCHESIYQYIYCVAPALIAWIPTCGSFI